jgi:hypothetical protein
MRPTLPTKLPSASLIIDIPARSPATLLNTRFMDRLNWLLFSYFNGLYLIEPHPRPAAMLHAVWPTRSASLLARGDNIQDCADYPQSDVRRRAVLSKSAARAFLGAAHLHLRRQTVDIDGDRHGRRTARPLSGIAFATAAMSGKALTSSPRASTTKRSA